MPTNSTVENLALVHGKITQSELQSKCSCGKQHRLPTLGMNTSLASVMNVFPALAKVLATILDHTQPVTRRQAFKKMLGCPCFTVKSIGSCDCPVSRICSGSLSIVLVNSKMVAVSAQIKLCLLK